MWLYLVRAKPKLEPDFWCVDEMEVDEIGLDEVGVQEIMAVDKLHVY